MSTPDILATWFHKRQNQTPGALLLPLLLPGLRSFWANGFDNIYQWYDMSMAGLRLTAHGSPTIGNASTWPGALVPYVNFGGTNEYFDHIDCAALSPTGDLAAGAWAYWDDFDNDMAVINKWHEADNKRSYRLWTDTSGYLKFSISDNGIDVQTVTTSTALSVATWYFVQGRCDVGSYIYVRADDNAWSSAATVMAAIDDNISSFYVGNMDTTPAKRLDGRVAQAWLCGFNVPSAVLDYIYAEQAPSFGKD